MCRFIAALTRGGPNAARSAALGNISTMSPEVPSSSGVVEDPAAVYAARLAQLAARRAKKGAETVSSAPLADKAAHRPSPILITPSSERFRTAWVIITAIV